MVEYSGTVFFTVVHIGGIMTNLYQS